MPASRKLAHLKHHQATYSSVLLVILSVASLQVLTSTSGQISPGTPIVGVFSNARATSNITDSILEPNSIFFVEVNVTDAPPFNGYEFTLYYDPNFLEAQSTTDTEKLGTDTVFGRPFVAKEERGVGSYRLSVVNLVPLPGGAYSLGSGTLVHIKFRVLNTGVSSLTLAAGTSQPSSFARDGAWTRLVLGRDIPGYKSGPIHVVTTDGYFKNDVGRLGPVAKFSFSPASPQAGQLVTFNATDSYDATTGSSTGISEYNWDLGYQGQSAIFSTPNPFATVRFASDQGLAIQGNFSVRLTVADSDDGFRGMVARIVEIEPVPVHDIAVTSLTVLPTIVEAGTSVFVTVLVSNKGTFTESFDLIVQYGPPTVNIASLVGETIAVQRSMSFNFTVDTSGLVPAVYEVDAIVSVSEDSRPSDNSRKSAFNVVLPSSSLLLYFVGGGFGIAGLIVGVGVFMKKRRRRDDL